MAMGRILSFGRMLPGELEGDVNPEDYGIQVTKEEEPTGQEAAEEIGRLYEGAKERSGIADPKLEQYIGKLAAGTVTTDPKASAGRRRGFRFRLRPIDS